MSTFKLSILAALVLLFQCGTALANDRTLLLKHKAWDVEHVFGTKTGTQWCQAGSFSAKGDMISLAIKQNGDVMMVVTLSKRFWSNDFEDDLILHIDYAPWTLNNASFSGRDGFSNVMFTFPTGPKFIEFLEDIYAGSAIAMKDANGDRSLATWSLAGSAAALLKLIECGERIGAIGSKNNGSGYGTSNSSGYGAANKSGYGWN